MKDNLKWDIHGKVYNDLIKGTKYYEFSISMSMLQLQIDVINMMVKGKQYSA